MTHGPSRIDLGSIWGRSRHVLRGNFKNIGACLGILVVLEARN